MYLIYLMILLISLLFFINHVNAQIKNNIFNLSKIDTPELQFNVFKIHSSILEIKKFPEKTINVTAIYNNPLISTSASISNMQSFCTFDAADYLKRNPGFFVIRNGGTNNDLVFRGMSKSQIRILTDNAEIGGACFSHMDPATTYIIPDTFDILNIIKGPQTVLFGPVKSGGVLQFQRYHPNFYEPEIQLRSNITAGSNNSISKNIDSILGNKNGYIRLVGNIAQAEDYRDGNRHRVHSAWYKWNMDAIVGYQINAATHIEVNLGQGNGSANYAIKPMDGLCFARENYGCKIEISDINDICDKVELQTWIYQTHHLMGDNTSTSKIFPTNTHPKHCCSNSYNISSFDRVLWGIREITSYQWNNIYFYSGMDIQTDQHRKNTKIKHIYEINSFIRDTGIFTEVVINYLLNKKFIGGIRLGQNVTRIYNDKDCFYYKFQKIYPAGFIRYETNIYQSLLYYIGIGISQRFPDYLELISHQSNEHVIETSCISQLKSEKNIQMDFGMHIKKPKIDGWITSYAGYIRNFIFYNNKNEKYIKYKSFNQINNINAQIYGSEVGLSYKFDDCWIGISSISWSWGLNIDNKCVLPTIPPLEGVIICQFKKKHYMLETSWRLVAPSESINKLCSLIHSNIYSSKTHINTPGFGVLSLYATWDTPLHCICSMGVNNLLNHNYVEYLNTFTSMQFNDSNKKPIYEPGRTWWIKVEMKL